LANDLKVCTLEDTTIAAFRQAVHQTNIDVLDQTNIDGQMIIGRQISYPDIALNN